jgi:hypothetical protein
LGLGFGGRGSWALYSDRVWEWDRGDLPRELGESDGSGLSITPTPTGSDVDEATSDVDEATSDPDRF